jgi:glycine/D-amino acid oxidase-like deaminating enzyme
MQSAQKWGEPLWRVDFDCPRGPLPARADAAIVGAGLTGLSAAYHLRRARPDWTVAVFEAQTVGAGASGRTGGIVLDDTAAGPVPEFARCLDFAAELVAREKIDCAWNTPGCWEIAHDLSLGKAPLDWNDQGAPLRVSRTLRGGTAEPGRLVAGLARAALAAGAVIHERCPVASLDFGPPPRLQLAGATIAAEWIVLATNGYFTQVSEIEEQGVALLALALATEPLEESALKAAGLAARIPFYTGDLPYLWGRLTSDNRLVAGAGLVAAAAGGVTRTSIHEASDAPKLFQELEGRIAGLHPALARVRFTHRWAGPIVITDDWRPVLRRHSRSPRVLVAGGYSGHGVAQSIRMGALVCDRITR